LVVGKWVQTNIPRHIFSAIELQLWLVLGKKAAKFLAWLFLNLVETDFYSLLGLAVPIKLP
jgi:hypothetical protein